MMWKFVAPALLASAILPSTLLVACGDDPVTIIDLTVVETMPVDFDGMQGGVTEGAIFELDDLRDEPAYVDAQGLLKCASIDAKASKLTVDKLTVGAGATTVDYKVGVRPHGSGAFTELARFAGSITSGDKVTLDSSKVTIDASGLQFLSQTVLGSAPRLDVEITATVPAGVDALQVSLALSIVLSSDPKGCPSVTTGL